MASSIVTNGFIVTNGLRTIATPVRMVSNYCNNTENGQLQLDQVSIFFLQLQQAVLGLMNAPMLNGSNKYIRQERGKR